jgi:hypothetical protein
MQCYEADVKKPIRGLLQGELARTLLIQVTMEEVGGGVKRGGGGVES